MWITDAVQKAVTRIAHVAYMDRQIAAYWNRKRELDEPAVFTGWYWTKGHVEGGPFKTRSAAFRDAYFRLVLNMAPPVLNQTRQRVRTAATERRVLQ